MFLYGKNSSAKEKFTIVNTVGYRTDGFHHSIQVPTLPKVIPVVDSIFRIQSPRYEA